MALINRISKLLQADMHAVIDSLEEPHTLLKQAVREMEDQLQQCRQKIKILELEQVQLEKQKSDLAQTIDKFELELDVCFESQEQNLARSLVKRKLETELVLKNLTSKSESLTRDLDSYKAQLKDNTERYASMRQKAEIFAEEDRSNVHCREAGSAAYGSEFSISDDQVEVAFLQERKRRSQHVVKSGVDHHE